MNLINIACVSFVFLLLINISEKIITKIIKMNIDLLKNNQINSKLFYKVILVTSFVAILITLFFTKYKTYAPEIEIRIKWNNLNKTGKMML